MGLSGLDSSIVSHFLVDSFLDLPIPEEEIKYEILGKLKNKLYGLGQVILQKDEQMFIEIIQYYETDNPRTLRAHRVRKALEHTLNQFHAQKL